MMTTPPPPPHKTPISPTSALHALTNLRSPRYTYPPPPFPPQSIFPTKTSSSHLFHLYLPDEDDHATLPQIPDLHTLKNLELEMKSLLALAQCRARNLSMHLHDLNAWIQSFDHPLSLTTVPGAISTSVSTPTTFTSLPLPPTPTFPPPLHISPPPPPLQLVPSPILNHEPIPGAVLSPNDVHQLSSKNFLKRKRSQSPPHPSSQSILSSPVSPPPIQSGTTPPNPPRIKIKLGNGSSMSPVTSPTHPLTMNNVDWPSGSSSNTVYKRKRIDKVLGKSNTAFNATSSSSYSRTSSGRSPRSSLVGSTSLFGWPSFSPAIPPPAVISTTLVTHTNRLYYHQNYLDTTRSSSGVMEEEIIGGDYSHPLPANKVQTVPAATFWAYLDPWLRDISEEDVRLLVVNEVGSDLRTRFHTGSESFGVPKDMLASLDPQDLKYFIVPAKPNPILTPTAPSSQIPAPSDLPPSTTTPLIPESQSVLPESDPYSDTITEYTPVPLATRLLASLQPLCTRRRRSVNGILVKSEPGTDEHANGTVQTDFDSVVEVSGTDTITEALDASIKNLDTCAVVELANKSAVPVETLYHRLIGELRVVGMLDPDLPSPTGESLADDSISDQLRIAQHALRIQLSLNKARRVRTLQLSRLRLAYQEYMHLIADIDSQLEQAFSERYVPKLEKKRGKKMKKNMTEDLSPDLSRLEVGAIPATTRPPFPEKIKGLLAKRKYLQATVGFVFESNPDLAYRSPDVSVFTDIAGNVEVDLGSGELEVPDTLPVHVTGEIPLSMWTYPPSFINLEEKDGFESSAPETAEIMSPVFKSSVPLNMGHWVGEPMDFK